MATTSNFLIIAAATAVVWLALSSRRERTGKLVGLPPGPPTIPILGNLLQIPRSRAHLRWVLKGHCNLYSHCFQIRTVGEGVRIRSHHSTPPAVGSSFAIANQLAGQAWASDCFRALAQSRRCWTSRVIARQIALPSTSTRSSLTTTTLCLRGTVRVFPVSWGRSS